MKEATLIAVSLCLFTLFICLYFMNTSMFLLLARVKNDIFFLVHYVAPRHCFPLNQWALITMKEKIKQIMLLLWQVSSEVLCLTCSGLNQTQDSLDQGKVFLLSGGQKTLALLLSRTQSTLTSYLGSSPNKNILHARIKQYFLD